MLTYLSRHYSTILTNEHLIFWIDVCPMFRLGTLISVRSCQMLCQYLVTHLFGFSSVLWQTGVFLPLMKSFTEKFAEDIHRIVFFELQDIPSTSILLKKRLFLTRSTISKKIPMLPHRFQNSLGKCARLLLTTQCRALHRSIKYAVNLQNKT